MFIFNAFKFINYNSNTSNVKDNSKSSNRNHSLILDRKKDRNRNRNICVCQNKDNNYVTTKSNFVNNCSVFQDSNSKIFDIPNSADRSRHDTESTFNYSRHSDLCSVSNISSIDSCNNKKNKHSSNISNSCSIIIGANSSIFNQNIFEKKHRDATVVESKDRLINTSKNINYLVGDSNRGVFPYTLRAFLKTQRCACLWISLQRSNSEKFFSDNYNINIKTTKSNTYAIMDNNTMSSSVDLCALSADMNNISTDNNSCSSNVSSSNVSVDRSSNADNSSSSSSSRINASILNDDNCSNENADFKNDIPCNSSETNTVSDTITVNNSNDSCNFFSSRFPNPSCSKSLLSNIFFPAKKSDKICANMNISNNVYEDSNNVRFNTFNIFGNDERRDDEESFINAENDSRTHNDIIGFDAKDELKSFTCSMHSDDAMSSDNSISAKQSNEESNNDINLSCSDINEKNDNNAELLLNCSNTNNNSPSNIPLSTSYAYVYNSQSSSSSSSSSSTFSSSFTLIPSYFTYFTSRRKAREDNGSEKERVKSKKKLQKKKEKKKNDEDSNLEDCYSERVKLQNKEENADSKKNKSSASSSFFPFFSFYNSSSSPSNSQITEEERKQKAESLKNTGNESFKKGYIETAIMHYTDAINLDKTQHVYWSNRALCYKKLGQWKKVVEDARQALNYEEESVKAHYLLGLALVHLGQTEEGMKKLTKAKTLSALTKSAYEQEIESAILKAKKMEWQKVAEEKHEKRNDLRSFIICSMNALRERGDIDDDELQRRYSQLEELFEDAQALWKPFDVPDFLCCKISMTLMKHPVCTRAGQTYDRVYIEEHIKHNGAFDPVSREPVDSASLVPNYAIKEATKYFLDKYPWIYDED